MHVTCLECLTAGAGKTLELATTTPDGMTHWVRYTNRKGPFRLCDFEPDSDAHVLQVEETRKGTQRVATPIWKIQ